GTGGSGGSGGAQCIDSGCNGFDPGSCCSGAYCAVWGKCVVCKNNNDGCSSDAQCCSGSCKWSNGWWRCG
ncbi:MAG: hypothetical protein KC776_39230, partial [Myxococcales bacterium]|nr:hypothetical protein [Myxococcales bacterium]